MGVLAAGERAIATTNRNFVGRMGHVESEVYLANPAIIRGSCFPLQSDDINCNQLQSDDNNAEQAQSDDIKNPRIRIRNRNTISDNRNRESREDDDDQMILPEEAKKIQTEHDRVLDAAEDAGFKMSNDVRATLIALYADHGLQKVLDGLKSCVEHGAPNLAYLKAVLKGEPRKEKPSGKIVNAQKYDQRDYSSEQEEAMRRMLQLGGTA